MGGGEFHGYLYAVQLSINHLYFIVSIMDCLF